jgi:hypothetical protein
MRTFVSSDEIMVDMPVSGCCSLPLKHEITMPAMMTPRMTAPASEQNTDMRMMFLVDRALPPPPDGAAACAGTPNEATPLEAAAAHAQGRCQE